ncbi:Flp pilus assembly protein CpaB [Nitratireductor aestuarii]|uniref:Flp pilus assembly protein CpaB n=1 Tax=Nitratireductor aestuarii TaxID=1735103 RepID=A0A916W0U3_9HYPH|nr:Flp pilus assembly protein CpaB [Nitratireductor aestuarii]GGA57759.1 Flp pilus assembly protein CpaB [Nitratireductor aestuarii]
MNRSRIVILGVAVVAAIGAGYIAKGMSSTPPAQTVANAPAEQPRIETRDVLLVSQQVNMGERVGPALKWQAWPSSIVDSSFITQEDRPEALDELKDAIARYTLYPGEPVRLPRLVVEGQNFMSAILSPGMRAVGIEIAADTSAGGFILPNDHVDVIMTRRSEDTATGSGYITETVLQNIRVLAIDQTVQDDENGNPVIIGKTATLELTPDQAEVITVAQRMADRLTLALRSVADVQEPSAKNGRHLVNGVNGSGIRIIKSGEMNTIGAR